MKKIIVLLSLVFAVFISSAQCVTTFTNQSQYGIAIDLSGNVYTLHNNQIKKISPSGVVSVIAGSGLEGHADGVGTLAQFNQPHDLTIDNEGNIYVLEYQNFNIRKITPAGQVSTLVQLSNNFDAGSSSAICVDNIGNLYLVHQNTIKKITPNGNVSDIAGSYLNFGFADGYGSSALFNFPEGIAVDINGFIYVADTGNNRIRKITSWGEVTTIAGSGIAGYADSNSTSTAQFNSPSGIAVNNTGNIIYVSDTGNYKIRKISDEFGVQPVTTLAGSNLSWNSVDGFGTLAQFALLYDIKLDALGNLYVNDGGDVRKIRKISKLTANFQYGIFTNASCFSSLITAPQPVILNGNGSYNGGVFSSTPGLGIDSSTGAITPSNSIQGIYTVTYTTPISGGCQTTTSHQVEISQEQVLMFNQVGPICQGINFTLPSFIETGISGNWEPAVNNNITTTYTFLPSYCQNAIPTTMTVEIIPLNTTATISADGTIATSTTITNGSSVQLQLNGTLNAQPNIQWTPATGISSPTVANPVVYPSTTTTYTASFINSNGCPQTTSFTVNVTPQPNIGNLSLSSSNTNVNLFDVITVNVQLTNATNLYSLYMKLKGNAAVSQYLNYTGHTAGTLLGTGGTVISTPPTVTNGVPDFGITKVGAVPGYSGSGLFYSFTFVPKNIVIPVGTTFCFYLDDVSAYNATGTSCGLTNQGQLCYTFTNQVAVWPGDLNNNKSVTTADLLPIGYFYNSTGPVRSDRSISWSAHPATLWGYNNSSTSGDAYKVFADSNGDGVITNGDQAAIGFNMNQVRARMASPAVSEAPPHFTAQQLTTAAGTLTVTPNNTIINGATLPQSVTFTVNLNNTGGLSSLYGISVNLVFDETVFDLSTETIDYAGSIFGNVGLDCLALDNTPYNSSTNLVSAGLTRFGNAPINGQGLLFKVTIQTKSTLPNVAITPVTAYVDAANNQAGDTLVVQDAPANNLTIINNLGTNTVKQDEFVLYPNPASDVVYLQMGANTQLAGMKVKVVNLLGQIIEEQPIQNSTTELSTKNWAAAGMYFVQITNQNNTTSITKKVMVERK